MIYTKNNSSRILNCNSLKASVEQHQLKLNNSLSIIDVNTPAIN